VIFSQHPAAFSAQGDVMLVDLNYYHTITKAGGLQTATSMHSLFRCRCGGLSHHLPHGRAKQNCAARCASQGRGHLVTFIQLGAR